MGVILTSRMNLKDLEVIECGTEYCEPNHDYGPAVRGFFIIHYVHSGEGYFRQGDKEYQLKGGDCFFIFPDAVSYYCADAKNPWHYSWVMFQGEKADFYLNKANINLTCPVIKACEDTAIIGCFKDMMDSEKFPKSKEIKLLSLLLKLLYYFIDETPDIKKSDEKANHKNMIQLQYINNSIEFIKTNYWKKITLKDIAEHIGIDSKYLCSLFKTYLHMSPYQYLLNVRFKRACELLLNPSFAIGDISRSVGYEDPLLFSKMFRKIKKISPSDYRKRNVDGIYDDKN